VVVFQDVCFFLVEVNRAPAACDTAVADQHFTNETVQLTGAFHLAGYQRVIGAVWPVADEAATKLPG
jgi:CHAT domain